MVAMTEHAGVSMTIQIVLRLTCVTTANQGKNEHHHITVAPCILVESWTNEFQSSRF
jgi:hypothetical protein